MASATKGGKLASTRKPASAGTYLVERYWPGVSRQDLIERVTRALRCAEDMRAAGAHVRYVEAMLIPSQDSVLCLFEADGPDAVADLNRLADLPFDRISLIDQLGVAALGKSAPERSSELAR